MRRGAINKVCLLFLLSLCFFAVACGQTEQERIEQSYKYEDKALELRQKGDLQSAIREQKKAIEINSKDAKPSVVLAGMYIEAEDWQKAAETAQKAIQLDPNQALGHSLLALALQKSGKKQEALLHREKAAMLDAENLDFAVNLGVAQENLGDNDSARKTYEKVLEKDRNYVYALVRLGLLEVEENNLEKGKELLTKAAAADSTSDKDKSFVEDARNKLKELNHQQKKTTQSPKSN